MYILGVYAWTPHQFRYFLLAFHFQNCWRHRTISGTWSLHSMRVSLTPRTPTRFIPVLFTTWSNSIRQQLSEETEEANVADQLATFLTIQGMPQAQIDYCGQPH